MMSWKTAPYVTAVCPSRNRQRFLPLLLKSFFSQTWIDSELLILDDSDPGYNTYIRDSRIRFVHIPPGTYKTVGEKRNAVNALATGNVIVHFDDDDWSAPTRIEDQLRCMRIENKEVVGFHDIYYWRENDETTYKFRYGGLGPYASGTSLCYTRKWWLDHPFPTINCGEDSSFAFFAKSKNQLASCDSCGRIVAVSHSGTTSNPGLGLYQFPAVSRDLFPKEFFEAVKSIHEHSYSTQAAGANPAS